MTETLEKLYLTLIFSLAQILSKIMEEEGLKTCSAASN